CVIRGFMQHSVERLRCGEGFTEWTGGVSTAREIVHIMHHAHDGPTHLPSLRLRCLVIYLHGQVFTHLQTELLRRRVIDDYGSLLVRPQPAPGQEDCTGEGEGQQRQRCPPRLAKETAHPQPGGLRHPAKSVSPGVSVPTGARLDTVCGHGLTNLYACDGPQGPQGRELWNQQAY